MRALIIATVLIAVGLFGGGAWYISGGSSNAVALTPDDRAVVALGSEVYKTQCASCHGAQLEGQPNWQRRRADGLLPAPPHDATGHTWHHPDGMLFALTKYGPGPATGNPSYRSDMPAYEDILGDHEIIAVLSYIKSRWPAPVRARHDDINRRANSG